MKMLIGLMTLSLSLASVASSGESKTFIYDGSRNSMELLLKGEKTHTEYRQETRNTICYREEVVYRRVCGGYGPGRGPFPGGCQTYPTYRSIPYPCTQVVSIPYEVKDYDVDARVLLDVTKLNASATASEALTATLNGDQLTLSTSSKKFLVMLKKNDVRSQMSGSVKFMDAFYAVEMIEAAPVLKALQMSDISLENSVLNFNLGPISNTANIGFALNVTYKRFLGSDTVMFDRELNMSEVELKANGAGSEAGVNVEKLGIALTEGKYALTAKAFFKAEGTLLNKDTFGDDLEASRTLIYKIR